MLRDDAFGDDEFGEGFDVAGFLLDDDAQFTRRADRFLGR
jgi:hypothetical protein